MVTAAHMLKIGEIGGFRNDRGIVDPNVSYVLNAVPG